MGNCQDQDEQEEQTGNGFIKKMRRGGRRITLKFAGKCTDCGAELAVGSTARWYGRGRIYGLTCHTQEVNPEPKPTPQTNGDGLPSPGGFKGFKGLFDPEETDADDYQPETEPKKYDCTIH